MNKLTIERLYNELKSKYMDYLNDTPYGGMMTQEDITHANGFMEGLKSLKDAIIKSLK